MVNAEAKRLHEFHCSGCSEYGNHGGGKVSTRREGPQGTDADSGSIPGRSTKLCPNCNERMTSSTSGWCGTCRSLKRAARNREIVAERKAGGCVDCGLNDPDVMQFDHVPERGTKRFTIAGSMGGVTNTRMEAELAKCDVVCANCHGRRTKARRVSPPPPTHEHKPECLVHLITSDHYVEDRGHVHNSGCYDC